MTIHVTRLDDVCEINPRMPKTVSDEDLASFLPMAAVSEDGHISFEEQREVREVKKGYTYFERGDVLIAKITPCFENGKATRTSSLINPIGFGSTEFHVLRAGDEIDPSYLFHLIWNSRFREVGANNMTGSAGQKRVPADFIKRLQIPLPPLDEQRRIAAILDKADALRRKRKRALELLNGLPQSIFVEMFGDPLKDQKDSGDWTCEPLDASISYIDYRGKTPPKAETGVRLITAKNVKMGYINPEPMEFIEADAYDHWMTRGFPKMGDVLFTTEAPLGNVAILDSPDKLAVGQRLLTMQPDKSKIKSEYLAYFLRSPGFSKKMIENSSGSTVRGIKSRLLKRIDICYPPIEHQARFAAALRTLNAIKEQASALHIGADSLFASLQHRAFSGQL